MRKIQLRTSGVNWGNGQGTVRTFIEEIEQQVQREVERAMSDVLVEEVDRLLGREPYQRRETRSGRRISGQCCRCGSQRQQAFVRNGYRQRQVVTSWGVLDIDYPRLRCGCGGSVAVTLEMLAPYQRVWDDISEQVQHLSELGLSLRQMQSELGTMLHPSLGLRTLNERLQQMKMTVQGELKAVPPVVMLDAIWVTVLAPSGQVRQDSQGRRRSHKRKVKRCVLVALGVWPQTGAWEVLDWELAPSEDQASWECLLVRLETRGLYAERGLYLFLHDGGKGLEAALRFLFPLVRRQRCVFHKLRNLWQAILIPDGFSAEQARRLRTQIVRQAAALFRAPDEAAAQTALHAFCSTWIASQPAVVTTLQRDLPDTFQFYAVLARFPRWRSASLRTTSLLERLNRALRRLFRAAAAYHSERGLAAATARVLLPYVAR